MHYLQYVYSPSVAYSLAYLQVGPGFGHDQSQWPEKESQLRSAYREAMRLAAGKAVDSVGFSLLSSGISRGGKSLADILHIACEAMQECCRTSSILVCTLQMEAFSQCMYRRSI